MSKIYLRQKQTKEELNEVWKNPEQVYVIHYSCESFYDRPLGNSAKVTCIATRNLKTGQTKSFSLHKISEIEKLPIDSNEDMLEKKMLDSFFNFLKEKKEYKWMHWNMRDESFGFQALEHRYRVLGGNPFELDDNKKFDLSRILIGIYGRGYISHPRFENLMHKNSISQPNFKNGAEEAKLYVQKNYIALHQSTLSKVDVLASLCQIAYENKLETNATWWELNGGSLRAMISWIQDHPVIIVFSLIGNLAWVIPFLVWVFK